MRSTAEASRSNGRSRCAASTRARPSIISPLGAGSMRRSPMRWAVPSRGTCAFCPRRCRALDRGARRLCRRACRGLRGAPRGVCSRASRRALTRDDVLRYRGLARCWRREAGRVLSAVSTETCILAISSCWKTGRCCSTPSSLATSSLGRRNVRPRLPADGSLSSATWRGCHIVFNRYLRGEGGRAFDALAALPFFLSMRAAIRAKVTAARLDNQGRRAPPRSQGCGENISLGLPPHHAGSARSGSGRRPVWYR